MGMSDGVRCQNPKCAKKIAEALDGRLTVVCPRCGTRQTIKRVALAGTATNRKEST